MKFSNLGNFYVKLFCQRSIVLLAQKKKQNKKKKKKKKTVKELNCKKEPRARVTLPTETSRRNSITRVKTIGNEARLEKSLPIVMHCRSD